MTMTILAAATLTTLAAVAAIHVYWGFGGTWPRRDSRTLAELVMGPGTTEMPGPIPSVVVALALTAMAALLLAARGTIELPVLTGQPLTVATWTAIAVLAVRGVGGFFQTMVQPSIRGSAYARANVRVYSPLCVALAAASAALVVV